MDDICTSIDDIETYTNVLTFEQFVLARQIQHAVLFNLQIIGETANHLDSTVRNTYTFVPWSKMIGMRNVIVHGYFGINLEMIWRTVTDDLPKLRSQIVAMLQDMEQ